MWEEWSIGAVEGSLYSPEGIVVELVVDREYCKVIVDSEV
jgi:hypothetical protein